MDVFTSYEMRKGVKREFNNFEYLFDFRHFIKYYYMISIPHHK